MTDLIDKKKIKLRKGLVKTLINRILSALNQNNISTYLIHEDIQETVELFFIKKNLDMRRQKEVHHYTLTVYKDFEIEGTKMRGSSTVGIYAGMTDEEIATKVKDAYFAASFVNNPYYELPSGEKEECVRLESSLASGSLADAAGKMAEALFSEDTLQDTFINSAELFVEKIINRIINSNGINVSFEKYMAKGEYVVQCVTPQDVETYQDFAYENLDAQALKDKVKQTLEITKARAQAATAPEAGEYNVILSGKHVGIICSYYLNRANASMIYPKYSNYAIGNNIQGQDVNGELLNITLKAKAPYSNEGIPMIDRPLITDGVLQTIHGSSRFAYYLGIEPTGDYHSIALPSGTKTFEEMKSGKYLYVLNFSDFQMDDLSGHFAGEIRLALLCDGETITPVTGGSINGNLLEAQKNLTFSKEMQKEINFEGPYAIRLENVSVAGA
nr:metallopeptidase TldD-related protein [uncultured Anaerocolumna sp.]